MKKIAILFANGTEEIEGISPVDILRRAGATCDMISVSEKLIVGSHQIKIECDKTIDQVNLYDYDAIVIPGGMPGATNISNCKKAIKEIGIAIKNNKLVCAICASPAVVLKKNNLIDCKATCFKAQEFIDILGDSYVDKSVFVHKNIITANGPKSAMEFSLEIVKNLGLSINF